MSARVRGQPRSNQGEVVEEERNLWNQLRSDAKAVDALVAKSNKLTARMLEIEKELNIAASRGETRYELEDEMEELCRQNLKLNEEVQSKIGEGDPNSDDSQSILQQMSLLAALRKGSEDDVTKTSSAARSASGQKPSRNLKRKLETATSTLTDDRDSVAADSPSVSVSSPKVVIGAPARDRLISKAASRSGSVPAVHGREASVKAEDSESLDGLTKVASVNRPPKIEVGTEVMYKESRDDGVGFLCVVVRVEKDGKQRRYMIKDAEPDEASNPANAPFEAKLSTFTTLPPSNDKLPDVPPRKPVIAMYPGTTTFYKAEVVGSKAKDGLVAPPQPGFVRLRFEGEDQADTELDVERRYVFPEWK